MLVNQDGTNAGDELLNAIDALEQEPTEGDVEEGEDVSEADADTVENTEDDDAELELDADAEDGEEAAEETGKHTVKIGGEELKVTLQELKDGYMKDADYRRKTSEVAETRKRAEALEGDYTNGLRTLEEQLTLVAGFVANQMTADEAEMDKLIAERPADALRLQRELSKKGTVLQQAHAQLQRIQQAKLDVQTKQTRETREQTLPALLEAFPDYRKSEAFDKLQTYLKDSYGLTKDITDTIADQRFTLLAEKARRYDAIKAKAALKDKQVKKAPVNFQKGGAAHRGNEAAKVREQSFKKVMTKGTVDNLAALF